jgi:hypothetical protein
VQREKDEKCRQAADAAEKDRQAAAKRKAEEKPVEMFETSDPEVVAQLRATYRPQSVQSKRAKNANGQVAFRIEDPERRGPGVAEAVAAKRRTCCTA